jgi:hypothetical protein
VLRTNQHFRIVLITDILVPISKWSVLSKVLESLVSRQRKAYFQEKNILNGMQSGFRSGHSTVSASLKVLNDIHCALDKKLHCVSDFIDCRRHLTPLTMLC